VSVAWENEVDRADAATGDWRIVDRRSGDGGAASRLTGHPDRVSRKRPFPV